MKILAIGDVHGDFKKIRKIPMNDIDLILLTGDLGKANLARKRFYENLKREKKGLPEIKEDANFIKNSHMEIYNSSMRILKYLAKYAPVLFIVGNVGMYDDEVRKMSKKFKIKLPLFVGTIKKMKNLRLISNRFTNFNGVRIGGLEFFVSDEYIREFKIKDRKRIKNALRESKKAKRILNWFNKNKVDILLCHQPPYRVLDRIKNKFLPKSFQGRHAGSKIILDYIKKHNLKYVFCGHIHEGEGKKKVGKTIVYNLGVVGHVIVEI